MKQPSISVAMATYNGERFLREQLDSLARQTLLPLELVVGDDGSTDGTLDILQTFAAKAPFPVRIYRNETRLGHTLNFFQAASRCSGDLIAFCDQDDVWLEMKLERCQSAICETGSKLVVHTAEMVDEELAPMGRRTSALRRAVCHDAAAARGWNTRLLLPWTDRTGAACAGFACVFQASLLTRVPPRPPVSAPNVGHDYWVYFAAEAVGTVTMLPDVLALYRVHDRSLSQAKYGVPQGRELVALSVGVGEAEYRHQAEKAVMTAEILAEAVQRAPELRPRLTRARKWYEARARSFSRRAALYHNGPSLSGAVRRLPGMVLRGVYRSQHMGGLGLKSFAKDLAVSVLPKAIKGRYDASVAPVGSARQEQSVCSMQ